MEYSALTLIEKGTFGQRLAGTGGKAQQAEVDRQPEDLGEETTACWRDRQ